MKKTDSGRAVYYYLRDEKNAPRVTVCLYFTPEGRTYRGIAVCAREDIVNKATGRAIARGRAIKAFKRDSFFEEVKRVPVTHCLFPYFSEIFPVNTAFKSGLAWKLTPFETKLKEKVYGK